MDPVSKLSKYFRAFPGIGLRQAKRFVYFLLNEEKAEVEELASAILELKKRVKTCPSCFRFILDRCDLCEKNKDSKILIVVEKDTDLETISKGGLAARYFVLGERYKELVEKIKKENITEIILAFSLTPQSEHKEEILRQMLTPITGERKIKISTLGRGLSTGLELEYSDPETLQNALRNRK